MAGGEWSAQNKVRPGAYINIKSNNLVTIPTNDTGIVAMPLFLTWGPSNEIIEITATTEIVPLLGGDYNDESLKPISAVLTNANKVLVYRVDSDADIKKAHAGTAGSSDIVVEALYGGTSGNDLSLIVTPSIADSSTTGTLRVLFKGIVRETFSFQDYKDLNNVVSKFVVFNNAAKAYTGAELTVNLTGGEQGEAEYNASTVQSFLKAIEDLELNVIAFPPDSPDTVTAEYTSTIPLVSSYIRRRRIEYGNKAVGVIFTNGADELKQPYEYMINIYNPVSGVNFIEQTAWVAGASAGAGPAGSNTYTAYPAAVRALPPTGGSVEALTNEVIIDALQKGYFVFTNKRDDVIVEQDLNGLTEFSVEKNQDFRKNRIIRCLDFIANDSKRDFEDNFIGKVTNNVEGRELFKASRTKALNTLQEDGAIQNFTSDDIVVEQGEQKESVLLKLWVQPADAMEKLYMEIVVL